MSVRAVFAKPAYRGLLGHAKRVARDRGTEAIGWLLGYFTPGSVTVLDSVGATRYKSQSRYGAQADPREELEIATSYPRNVGIVGLYHSHPFKDETQHAIFHSATDDATLKSRASRRGEYLSVVTDGQDAEVFVLEGGKTEVEPEIVDGLSYRDALHRYVCKVSLRLREDLALEGMEGLLAALEVAVSKAIKGALYEENATVDTEKRVVNAAKGRASGGNLLRVTPTNGGASVEFSLQTEAVIYLAPAQEDKLLSVLRNEIQDDVVYLLWNGLDPKALTGPVTPLEANLGSLRVQETNPLPRKVYKAAARGMVKKRVT